MGDGRDYIGKRRRKKERRKLEQEEEKEELERINLVNMRSSFPI